MQVQAVTCKVDELGALAWDVGEVQQRAHVLRQGASRSAGSDTQCINPLVLRCLLLRFRTLVQSPLVLLCFGNAGSVGPVLIALRMAQV